MKILLTGGAGCLGSNLIEHLLPKGHDILVIDNFATGNKESIAGIPGLQVIEGSITNEELLNRSFKEFAPTHVIHSAAAYKDPSDWKEDTETNVVGSILVAKTSLQYNVKKVINFQTALCYGRPAQVPIPVTHPTAPFTSYGISKVAGEAFLLQSGLPVVSLRLGNICGPRLAIGPIPTFYKRIKAGQNCFCSNTVRDFLDMSDFFSLVDIVLKDESPVGVFNVSTGEGKSIKDVFDAVASYLGMAPPDPPVLPAGADDVPVVVLDPSHTEQSLGWKAKIDFHETINRQLKWYDAHGVSAIFSHLAAPVTK